MESGASDDAIRQQRVGRIRQVLKDLPLKQQTVVTLRYHMQMSFDEIAVVLV
jgi:DNA-directed RNA polymerase specialized sigma24 family protein